MKRRRPPAADRQSAWSGRVERREVYVMTVAKVIEINAESNVSFEDAVRQGITKASDSVHNIKGAWIKEQKVTVEAGNIVKYRVDLKVTFVLD
jgi:flavin-binding protein dodecin